MTHRACTVLLALAVATATAGEPKPQAPPVSPPAQVDIIVKLMESTVRLKGAGGSGTAFLLLLNEVQGLAPAVVLITAAHVLESMGDTCELTIRASKPDGTWAPFMVPLAIRQGGRKRWVSHPNADIAAMFVNLERNLVPSDGFLTSSCLVEDDLMHTLEIRTGDEAFTFSFPRGVIANEEGYPILRAGHIASYPLYPTRSTKGFIMDTGLYEGEYGAPVLVLRQMTKEITGVEMPSGRLGVIVGLIAKPYDGTTKVQFQTVLPASMIRDTLVLLAEAERRTGSSLVTPKI